MLSTRCAVCVCFWARKFDFSPEMSTAHAHKKVDLRDKFTGPYCDIDYWLVIVGIKRRPKEGMDPDEALICTSL